MPARPHTYRFTVLGRYRARLRSSEPHVTVNLATGVGTGGDAAGDVFLSIEGLIGSTFDDILTGDINDTLVGGGGNDTLVGGSGADSLDGGAGIDVADYSNSAAAVTVDSQDRVYCFNRNAEHPVVIFDRDGKFLTSWGAGMFTFPHAIRIDEQDFVWLTDEIMASS